MTTSDFWDVLVVDDDPEIHSVTKLALSGVEFWGRALRFHHAYSGTEAIDALVHNPEIIILDEPTAGVDVELRKNLWNYIRELNQKGTTICLTTHYLEEAENLCDYITIINKGKILKSDTKKNLLNLIGKKIVNFSLNNSIKIPSDLKKYKPEIVKNNFDLRPAAIIEEFDLKNLPKKMGGQFFRKTASYGHFGRNDLKLPWEDVDTKAHQLTEASKKFL